MTKDELTSSILQTDFKKKFRMNNVLCLDIMYQNSHWNSTKSHKIDYRIYNFPLHVRIEVACTHMQSFNKQVLGKKL